MTLTELKALLATLPETTRVSIVVQEYARDSGHATAARFAFDTAQLTQKVMSCYLSRRWFMTNPIRSGSSSDSFHDPDSSGLAGRERTRQTGGRRIGIR